MGLAQYTYNRSTSGGEIIRELINSTDGQGLHFDGAAGNIDIASPPDLGTKFSFEFIIQADAWGSAIHYLLDFGSSGRFALLSSSDNSYKLGIYDGSHRSFGVSPLSDLKVHHLVVTVDDTAAILYDNGNQIATATIATPTLDLAADLKIGSKYDGNVATLFNGSMYRTRFWNKTLSSTEVTDAYENATVPFADQYGSAANIVAGYDFSSGWAVYNSSNVNATTQNVTTASGWWRKDYTLTPNKKHRVRIVGTQQSGQTFVIRDYDGSDASAAWTDIVATAGTLSATGIVGGSTFNIEATYIPDENGFMLQGGAGTGNIAITTFTVLQLGCVADYDLAFANPTQSLMVQDRAGAADGTASSGVTQVTPIEQLNSKSARIGTSAATPADGQIITGDLKSDNGQLDWARNSTGSALTVTQSGSGPAAVLTGGDVDIADGDLSVNGEATIERFASYRNLTLQRAQGTSASPTTIANGQTLGKLSFKGYTGSVYREGAAIAGKVSAGVSGDEIPSSLIFYTAADGATSATERLTIDSAGRLKVTEGNPLRWQSSSGVARCQISGDSSGSIILGTGASVTDRLTINSAGLATFSAGIAFQSATEGSGTSGEAFTLNRYETGTFTPTLSFGGASTGITYDYQEGAYTRIGNVCHVAILINLSSKGTSTGAAKIEGLPFPGANKLPSTGIESNLTFPYNTDLSAGEYIAAFVTQLTDKIQLREVSGADRTNANFTDNSDFRLCGSYMCNDA